MDEHLRGIRAKNQSGKHIDKAVEQLGVEWGIHQSKELKAANVPCIHYYTRSNSSQVKSIAKEVF
jgi:methylenetetrahydrofolate reductase (NADPH)